MIQGIGVDTIQISRVRKALDRHGSRFAEKILTEQELRVFESHSSPERYLAKRYAVKEAFSKAFGTGMRVPVTWKNIGTHHDGLGAPRIILSGTLDQMARDRGLLNMHVSVTDEEDLATAFVILEGK